MGEGGRANSGSCRGGRHPPAPLRSGPGEGAPLRHTAAGVVTQLIGLRLGDVNFDVLHRQLKVFYHN